MFGQIRNYGIGNVGRLSRR